MSSLKKSQFWIMIIGMLSVIAGVQIIITGKLRTVIFLGDQKYIIGGAFIFFGLYIFAVMLNKVRK